jgi:hypothetical protein
MRRAPIVLAGTAAGLAAVLTFKPREPTLPVATAATAPPNDAPRAIAIAAFLSSACITRTSGCGWSSR